MLMKLEADKMKPAIERAKAERMKVRIINVDERKYAVESKEKTYTVRFVVVNGLKLAECSCPARTYCKHIAASAAVNMGIQGMRLRLSTPVSEEARREAFIRRNTGWMV